jgi:hypothetical protein
MEKITATGLEFALALVDHMDKICMTVVAEKLNPFVLVEAV